MQTTKKRRLAALRRIEALDAHRASSPGIGPRGARWGALAGAGFLTAFLWDLSGVPTFAVLLAAVGWPCVPLLFPRWRRALLDKRSWTELELDALMRYAPVDIPAFQALQEAVRRSGRLDSVDLDIWLREERGALLAIDGSTPALAALTERKIGTP